MSTRPGLPGNGWIRKYMKALLDSELVTMRG